MSMYGRDPWGGPLEICHDSATDDDRSRNLDIDRGALSRTLDETQQSWLLAGPGDQGRKKKKYVDIGCLVVSRKLFVWTVGVLVAAAVFAGVVAGIAKAIPRHHRPPPPPDDYTVALHKALMFFNAQRSGKLPKHNNVPWRGNSCMKDGLSDPAVRRSLVGGYYDAGNAVKFNFPAAFSMTLLSWSVIEYSAKYEAVGELGHVHDIIKWGADYFLKTFNSTADSIDRVVAQVGSGATSPGSSQPNDHYCWMRPEDIDYPRPVVECHACSDLAAEMAAALAASSIVFKDNKAYSQKLVHGATTLFQFARDRRGKYSAGGSDAAKFYNSTSYWDEFVWSSSWMYLATGNSSYLTLATHPKLAKHAGAFWGGPDYGVFSWDNKLTGAQVLLSRLRLFLSPGYPYEEMLRTFHNQTSIIMCSYLPIFKSFNRTKGGLIQLNHGKPQPLQYVVNAAFLASVFSDYLKAADTPGWYCGPHFYSVEVLRNFARTQPISTTPEPFHKSLSKSTSGIKRHGQKLPPDSESFHRTEISKVHPFQAARNPGKELEAMDSIDQPYRFPLLEDDDSRENAKECTGDGSVSIFRHPASKKHTGNWKACSLTLVCFFCLYLAFSSITKNLVSYLTESLHEANVAAARNVSIWHGTSYLAPLFGAFLADSYLGNYWTIVIFCTIFIIGMVILVLSAALPLISTVLQVSLAWTSAESSQCIVVFVGLYMVALGYGALYPCITSFGADQFDHTDEEERNRKSSFFNWRCFILNAASLTSGTIIVWVQDREGWFWGFTVAALFVALGAGTFLLGSTMYRFQKPRGSPVARVCQVIVAATRNFKKDLPCDCSLLYEISGQGSSIDGRRKLEHTDGLEFFDKAAIVISSDSESVCMLNPRGVCTVTQVEELKILIRMFPIWMTMILFSTVLEQMYSTFVEQAMVMDKNIGGLEIPAASFQIVDVIAVLVLLPVYEKVLVPVLKKFTGVATGITPLQRMGIGLVFSTLSMVSAALVESYRLQIAHAKGLVHRKAPVPMSILWQGPQYFLIGAGEVFAIGLNEFFYEEAPDAMRSLCLAFSFANDSVGYYLSSLIISLVPVFTARGGSSGWIPDNLNEGHLDRFYWMMAGLSVLNLLAFVLCAMKYKSKRHCKD